jgi:hypothetical protein
LRQSPGLAIVAPRTGTLAFAGIQGGRALQPRRIPQSNGQSSFTDSERHLILAAETLRAGDSSARPASPEKPEERVSVFWRVFGGTILSICALLVINAYQSIGNSIHELRADLGRLRETSGDFVRKDEFNSRQTALWNAFKDMQSLQTTVSVLNNKLTALEQQIGGPDRIQKELLAVSTALTALREKDGILEKLIKDAETERREFTKEFQLIRERIAKLEGHSEKKATAP